VSAAGASVSLGAALISVFFTATVLTKFLQRRTPYNLAWTLGLAMFSVATAAQVVGELYGYSDAVFRLWYFFGISNVGLLGLGSVYIANRRAGHGFAVFMLFILAVFAGVVALSATNANALATFGNPFPPTGAGWAVSTPRLITPVINILGAAALIGIALYGLVKFHLRYNAYIATGGIVLGIATALTRFDQASFFYVGLFAGIAVLFFGFLKAVEWAKEHRRTTPQGGPPPARAEAPESSEPGATAPK